MPKTRRDLYSAIADIVGGKRGKRMRASLEKAPITDPLLAQPVSDERFEAELLKLEKMSKHERPGFILDGDSWSLPN